MPPILAIVLEILENEAEIADSPSSNSNPHPQNPQNPQTMHAVWLHYCTHFAESPAELVDRCFRLGRQKFLWDYDQCNYGRCRFKANCKGF
jgi:hypothetical protein